MALNIDGTTGISGVDGSASAASIAGTDANTGLSFASDTVNINTGGVTRATVDSAGNVGLGSTSPTDYDSAADNLVVQGSGNTGITLATTNTASNTSLVFSDGTGDADSKLRGAVQYIHNGDAMRFLTSSAERIRIDQNGHFLIGTDTARSGNTSFTLEPSNAFFQLRFTGTGNLSQVSFMRNTDSSATEVGNISTNGSATTYNTSSDYRLKENVVGISDGITRLKTLKPYRFNFIIDPDKTVDGFLAHEVTPVVPEAITGTKDEVDSDNNPVYQGIDQSKLVPLLTAALQEAVAKIEVLETKVAALEAG